MGTCRKVCPLFCQLSSFFYRTPIIINIKQYYEELLNKSDTVFFIFDVCQYLQNNKGYADRTNDRFDFIYDMKSSKIKELVFIGTHLDKIPASRQKKISDEFLKVISNRKYSDMFEHLLFINATETEEIRAKFSEIFKS